MDIDTDNIGPVQRQVLAIIASREADDGPGAPAPFWDDSHKRAIRRLEDRDVVEVTDRRPFGPAIEWRVCRTR